MKINRAEIVQLEQDLIRAISTSDIKFLDERLHDDLLFLAPNGQVITKSIDLASHQAGQMVVERIIPAIEEINIIGDTAVVVILYDTKGKMLDNPIEGLFRYIRIWKQVDGRLQVVGGSCFKI